MSTQNPELSPGLVSDEQFETVASFSGIRGEKLLDALRQHFVNGLPQCDVIVKTGVNQSLLSRKVAAFQSVSGRLAEAAKHYQAGV